MRENDLSGLENLELLMLHSNTIHSIEDRAFQDLKSLQVKAFRFMSIVLEYKFTALEYQKQSSVMSLQHSPWFSPMT